ncbi:hypothetical protein ACFOU0_02310 [Salinicoccus sesuvii]|uniref:3-methyladenine DNA glycosylase n=1 Tax=Salinicoccus sesuvii TaxID=868281 RepID=A0ABV7N2N7_9STAP
MADEKKNRMTTKEDEAQLKDRDERGPEGEVKEDVAPDNPPEQANKEEAERVEDVQQQKDDKEPLDNED